VDEQKSVPASEFENGRQISMSVGRFTLIKLEGPGQADTEVWQAEDANKQPVALKLIKNPSDGRREHLLKEHNCYNILLKSGPSGKNVCDLGEFDHGNVKYLALVRPYVKGRNLLDYADEKTLNLRCRIELMAKVCEAVAELHKQNLGHRDLKPANILVTAEGTPVLIDFGTASIPEEQAHTHRQTTTSIAFTWGYDPPESDGVNQVILFSKNFKQWDVFALGIIMAELLTGWRTSSDRRLQYCEEGGCQVHASLRHLANTLDGERVKTVAANFGCESPKAWQEDVVGKFDDALELIALRSRHDLLEPDPDSNGFPESFPPAVHRYANASEMATGLSRWLLGRNAQIGPQKASRKQRMSRSGMESWMEYVGMIRAASAHLRVGAYLSAKQVLDAIDQKSTARNRWEYRHLYAGCHAEIKKLALDQLFYAAFGPDEQSVVLFAKDGTRNVLSAESGKVLVSGPSIEGGGFEEPSSSLPLRPSFTPDHKLVVDVNEHGNVMIWSTEDKGWQMFEEVPYSGPRPDEEDRVFDLPQPPFVQVDHLSESGQRAEFSPDGTRLVVLEWDRSHLRILSTDGFKLCQRFGPFSGISMASLSQDGRRLVVVHDDADKKPAGKLNKCNDKQVSVWDTATGNCCFRLEGIMDAAAFSPCGRHIATWSSTLSSPNKTQVQIWDAGSGKERHRLAHKWGQIRSVLFSPDGDKVMIVGTKTTTVGEQAYGHVWCAFTGKRLFALPDRTNQGIRFAAFNPSGDQIITTCGEVASLWDAATGDRLFDLRGHEQNISGASFSQDGSRVLTFSRGDGTVRIWAAVMYGNFVQLAGSSGRWPPANSLDRSRLVLGSPDDGRKVVLWDTEAGRSLFTMGSPQGKGKVTMSAISPDGTRVITAFENSPPCVWDADGHRVLFSLANHVRHRDRVSAVAFSHDGGRIATAYQDGSIRVWDSQNGEIVSAMHGHGHTKAICTVDFSTDGRRVLTGSEDKTARVWNVENGEEEYLLQCDWPAHGCCFGSDGKIVYAWSDRSAKVWNIDRPISDEHWERVCRSASDPEFLEMHGISAEALRKAPLSREKHRKSVVQVYSSTRSAADIPFRPTLSPNGRFFAGAHEFERNVEIFDVVRGFIPTAVLNGHVSFVTSASFSPCSTRLVIASQNLAIIWDTATWDKLLELRADHSECGGFDKAMFSRDGKAIVTYGKDTAQLWTSSSIEERLRNHQAQPILGGKITHDKVKRPSR
jgi:WD40 repeat protein/serine/threonine protein kinase